ncbi:chromosome partitioning protein ParA [Vibrio pectenicida]|uniref:Chromosome partitioning protein ParA n=1 Tax=Vibrio pectenicida TaxID=62763 RepID=A0A7Y3ZZM7_9VIBR|nr:chromosome partitioning protein ParA [Vibrio pectenicida]NOH71159.1 chromosome partitioning protein ParA [Vibrio pectenicida]
MDLAALLTTPLLTTESLFALAIDVGLLILLVWFVILLLMIREFRQFARDVVHGPESSSNSEIDSQTYELCQESVESALSYTTINNDTLNDLIIIQKALEAQISQIRAAGEGSLTADEQESIDDLNQQLSKSHQLIRKLKGDLDRSMEGLRKAKGKLEKQSDTVDSLRQEKEQLEKQFEQLEKEYMQISETGGFNKIEQEYHQERQQLLNIIENYKKKISEKPEGGAGSSSEELEAIQQQLHHVTKEKEFVENKYLDLLKESEKKAEDDSNQ